MESTLASLCETARRQFEAAWKEQRPEAIEKHLPPPDDPHFLPTLEELVHIDLEMRWKTSKAQAAPGAGNGQTAVLVEAYLDRFPQMRERAVVLRLLRQEYRVRHSYGDAPATDEYVARFPQYVQNSAEVETLVRSADGSSKPDQRLPPVSARLPVVPGYEILEVLGRGGMGVVYKARQLGLNRIVALKMIRLGAQADEDDLTRFRIEAEASAHLQHPNIVQIYEIGETDGQPHFSLEYVEGGSLDRLLRGVPQPARAGADLVETLARAMHYAHQRGILHRDLKPANVLLLSPAAAPHGAGSAPSGSAQSAISLEGVIPKITDFGLAKRLQADSGQTQTGAIVGTPAYMAPEQAAGRKDITAAADVYALGVILYEMLTGRPPFRGPTSYDTIAQVLTEEPVPPSRLQPKTPRDIETICLKCLDKDPVKRYPSAEALADDLGRFLRDEPIQARPIGTAGRIWRWARRNPRAAVLVSLLAFVLLTGVPSLIGLWLLAEGRREVAEGTQKDLEKQRDAATSAQKAADDAAFRARAAIKKSFILATEHPEYQRDGMHAARKLLLDEALAYLQDFTKQRKQDPALREDLADAHERVGYILTERGAIPEALAEFEEGARLFERLLADRPSDAMLQSRLATCLEAAATRKRMLGRYRDAAEINDRAFKLRQTLVDQHPNNPNHERARAAILLDVGELQIALKSPKEALNSFEQARHVFERLHKAYPQNELVQKNLAATLIHLGQTLRKLGRPADAIALYDKAVEVRESLLAKYAFPAHRSELARTHGELALVQEDLLQHEQAQRSHEKAIALRETLVKLNPGIPEYHFDLAHSYSNYASFFFSDKKPDPDGRALDFRRKSLEHLEQAQRLNPRSVEYRHKLAQGHVILSNSLRSLKQPDKAQEHLTSAIEIWKAIVELKQDVAEHRYQLASGYGQLAHLRRQAKDFTEAIALFERSNLLLDELTKASPEVPAYRKEMSENCVNLAVCFQHLKQAERTLQLLMRAITLRQELVRAYPQVPEYKTALDRVMTNTVGAAAYEVNRKHPLDYSAKPIDILARQQERRILWRHWVTDYPAMHPFRQRLMHCEMEIAGLQQGLKQFAESLKTYQSAHALADELVRQHPDVREYAASQAHVNFKLGEHYRFTADTKKSLEFLDLAKQQYTTLVERYPERPGLRHLLAETLHYRGLGLLTLENCEEAVAAFSLAVDYQKQAIAGDPKNTAFPEMLDWHYTGVATTSWRLGRYREAVSATLERRELRPDNVKVLYAVAADLARCVNNVAQTSVPDKDAMRREFLEHTLDTLRQAHSRGFSDVKRIEGDPAFAPLLSLPEFQRVLAKMQGKSR